MKVGIIGANGYSGIELIRLLLQHSQVTLELIISHSNNGKRITELYPHLTSILELELDDLDVEEISKKVELLFFATPSGVSQEWIPLFLEKGIKCIDLSGDFRLVDSKDYPIWYNFTHSNPWYLEQSTYGLVEIFGEKIKNSSLIANPGCYPTAALLGLIPSVQHKLIDTSSIIIDGKTGVSGAGRKLSFASHYAEVNENVKAYKLGKHQHIPEIEQILTEISDEAIQLSFTTHLIPMTRGIMCTIYAKMEEQLSTDELINLYENYYESSKFVRIRPSGNMPSTKEVYGSNYCDIGLMVDERTNRLVIISVIDNVVKGASGQAIQNMNLLNNWEEDTGLWNTPVYP